MTAPLAGIRVVELASFVAAPAAGALLADLGAEVIKVEVPWGEIYRHSLPRLAGYASDFPLAPHFQMDNRGKRSLVLDLGRAAARQALDRVLDRSDVLLTNLLPSRLSRYALDPATLRRERPALILASLTGYGLHGVVGVTGVGMRGVPEGHDPVAHELVHPGDEQVVVDLGRIHELEEVPLVETGAREHRHGVVPAVLEGLVGRCRE